MGKKVKKTAGKKTKPGKPTISACMIVKNEEELLPQCLRSIKNVVDEIIVVDTGSSDRTVEIAESFGAKVYHHPWENDFSKHRNQSISYAKGEWILIIDADEEFYAEDAAILREAIKDSKADFMYLQCFDMESTGEPHGVFNQVRLFRNGLGMQYSRSVHNQLQVVGRSFYSKLRFRHFGYDLDPLKMEEKHQRTTSLLQKAIEADPGDPFNYFQLSSSYSMNREYRKAIEQGEKALGLMKERRLNNAYFSTVYYTVAQAYFTLGELEKAEQTCVEAIGFFGLDLNAYHLLAAIYFKMGERPRCKEVSLRYLDILRTFKEDPEKMMGLYFNSYAREHEIYYGLGFINFTENQQEKGEESLDLAFEIQGKPKEKALEIARFFLNRNMELMAISWLARAFDSGFADTDVLKAFVEQFTTRIGALETRRLLEQKSCSFSNFSGYWTLLGDLCRKEDDLDAAIHYYQKSTDLEPSDHRVFMKLSHCYECRGETDLAADACERSLNRQSPSGQDLLRMSGLQVKRGNLKEASSWLKRIKDDDLDRIQACEKTMLELTISWGLGEIDSFLVKLEGMMKRFDMTVNGTLDSTIQLGRILYELTEKLCIKQYWKPAESSLSLALAIAPEIFPAERFTSLLSFQSAPLSK